MSISRETLDRLAQFDTPTICNVIELFEVRPQHCGFMDGRIRANFPHLPPMVGFACTSAFRSSAPPGKGDAYASVVDQIKTFPELPGPAVVVFQDLDDPAVGATFGEVMCSCYRAFGSAGLITSGGGRDLDQVRALDYPVFTGSSICAHAHCHVLHVGLPVRVGSLVVNQGDLLHGDGNGVTSIPLEIASEIPDVATGLVAAEKLVLDYVRSEGEKNPEGLAEKIAMAGREFARLREKVSRRLRGK
jgi:regulator of RNase E activity RraA